MLLTSESHMRDPGPPVGECWYYVAYDGEDPNDPNYVPTYRISSVRINNQHPTKTARFSVYRAGDNRDNPFFVVDRPPLTDETWAAKANQNFDGTQYSIGMRFI